MRICFLTHNLMQDNGGGVFSRRLIAGIRDALSAEVIALTAVPSGEPYARSILISNKLRLVGRIFRIRAVIRDCDAVHALDAFPYGFIGAVASVGLGKRLIITAIGSGSILPFYQWYFAPLMRWTYRRADRIVAISAFTRAEILKKMPDLEIAVINPGVDADEFATSDRRPASSDLIQKYRPYILSVGQLRWRKGYHFSIRAFAKIAVLFPALHYLIVGKRYNEVYERRLENMIMELGLQGRVHIMQDVEADSRDPLAEIYKNAELFCLFSQNRNHDIEGFGLVFLEAAAAGIPVVGSKNCGVDDAVRDGENGILVSGRNPDDFADAVITILKDPAKKKSMADASRVFARAMSWERQSAQYAVMYRDIVK